MMRTESQAPSRLFLGPLLAAALFHIALMGLYVGAYHGDMSALVCGSIDEIGRWPYEDIRVGFPPRGFDGKIYYVLARNPWRLYDESIILLPAYRHGRILYPGLAWALSGGGDPERLFWVLPAINLAAIIGLAWLGARLAVHFARSPWWGVLLPVVLNTGMCALRDLTDPLATLTICGVITAWLLRWPAWQLAAWSVAAALSREQNNLILAIVLFEALWAGCRSRAIALTAALLIAVGWVLTIRAVYGVWPLAPGNVSPPFVGMWYRWTHLQGLSGALTRPLHIAGMLLLSVEVILSLALAFFRASRLAVLVALAGAGLALLGGTGIYENGWSYSRVFLWMPLGIWLWSMESRRRWPVFLLTATVFWQLAAVAQVWSR
jgi:hypothetical protein